MGVESGAGVVYSVLDHHRLGKSSSEQPQSQVGVFLEAACRMPVTIEERNNIDYRHDRDGSSSFVGSSDRSSPRGGAVHLCHIHGLPGDSAASIRSHPEPKKSFVSKFVSLK